MYSAIRNGIGGGIDVWRQWLLVAFGPVYAEQYSNGAPPQQMPFEALAFPYLTGVSVPALKLSLTFFGIFFVLVRQVCPYDRKRSKITLVIAWLVSIMLWWHLYRSGESFNMFVDFYCLLPKRYQQNHMCFRSALAVGTFQGPGPKPDCLRWEIPLRFSDIIGNALLLLSYLTLFGYTKNVLPAPATAIIRSRRGLNVFFTLITS